MALYHLRFFFFTFTLRWKDKESNSPCLWYFYVLLEIEANSKLTEGLIPFTKVTSNLMGLKISDDNYVVNTAANKTLTGLLVCNKNTTLIPLFPTITEVHISLLVCILAFYLMNRCSSNFLLILNLSICRLFCWWDLPCSTFCICLLRNKRSSTAKRLFCGYVHLAKWK